MNVCIFDLAELSGGRLTLGAMPPRDGEWACVQRICLIADEAREGDVFWCLDGGPADVELAFLRGALGVVSSWECEPWAGRFSLQVAEPSAALESVVSGMLRRFGGGRRACEEESWANCSELKDLQLPRAGAIANLPPTCGQGSKSQAAMRCRRLAA
jgi:hypothetical protein